MKGKYWHFATGLILGAALFGSGAALAAGILAEPSTQTFFVDGKQIQMEAYAIGGNNYVKLRDVGRAVDFGVAYDGATNSVRMDSTAPYTEETPTVKPTPSAGVRQDFSQQATPTIFTSDLTREVYNAMRQTVVDKDTLLAGDGKVIATATTTEGRRMVMEEVAAAMGNYPVYSIESLAVGQLSCTVKHPTSYAEATTHTQAFIDRISNLEQAEQVREIAWYVCDRLTYESTALASPRTVLTTDGVTAGNCMSYAHNFLFLCNRAGIPGILLHSENHQWNRVYVDGQWWDVDLTSDDVGDDTRLRPKSTILHKQSEMQGYDYINTAPEITAFVMELLVPGSTK